MICPSAGGVDQPARNTRNEKRVVDLQLNHRVKLFIAGIKHAIQLLSLWHCTREAI